MNCEQIQIEFLKTNISKAYSSANIAHEVLFKDTHDRDNEIIASILLSEAISIISSCKAVYFSNFELLQNATVENIFSKFDTYSNEFLRNVSTNHSHQWTDIEFINFKEAVPYLVETII